MLGDNFAKVSMPLFAKHWNEKDFDKLNEVYKTTTRINCYLVMPIALILIINSSKILDLLGKGYEGGEIIFIFILISQFINSFTGPNGSILVMTKFSKYEIFNGIIKLLIAIITIWFWGGKYNWAVAISIAISEIGVNILKTIQVKKYIGIFPYEIKNLIYIFIMGSIEVLIFMLIKNISNIWGWMFLNGLALIAFYILTFDFSPITEDKQIIKKVLITFKKVL